MHILATIFKSLNLSNNSVQTILRLTSSCLGFKHDIDNGIEKIKTLITTYEDCAPNIPVPMQTPAALLTAGTTQPPAISTPPISASMQNPGLGLPLSH